MRIPKKIFTSSAFQEMSKFQQTILNDKNFSAEEFADRLGILEKEFRKDGNLDVFCNEADRLADKLFEMKRDNFVGIIMSALCKTNEFKPKALEYFAWKGFDIASINKDIVHMVARLTDLKFIYRDNPHTFRQYLDILSKQEHCLDTLTHNYEDVSKNYHTIHRKIAPQGTYERMLACIQIELGKYLKYSNPRRAHYILTSASKIFS